VEVEEKGRRGVVSAGMMGPCRGEVPWSSWEP